MTLEEKLNNFIDYPGNDVTIGEYRASDRIFHRFRHEAGFPTLVRKKGVLLEHPRIELYR